MNDFKDARNCATEQGCEEQEALKKEEGSHEFSEKGSELYAKE